MSRLSDVEQRYGERPKVPMAHGELLLEQHAVGQTMDGTKFVWCPVGFIVSWHPGDHANEYCAWCRDYVSNLQPVSMETP